MFSGIRWLSIVDLGVSQLYLSEAKIANVKKWLNPNDLSNFEPLPVHDFGNGKFTLTDGHSRAFLAYTMGISCVPCVYDNDDIVSSKMDKFFTKMTFVGVSVLKSVPLWILRIGLYRIMCIKSVGYNAATGHTIYLRKQLRDNARNCKVFTRICIYMEPMKMQPCAFLKMMREHLFLYQWLSWNSM